MKTGLLGPVAGTVVVVGNGMVSQRFCDQLRRRTNAQTTRIIVFGEEPWPAYDRVQLTKYFQLSSADPLLLATRTWYANNDIELRTSARVDEHAARVSFVAQVRCEEDGVVLSVRDMRDRHVEAG